MKLHEISNNGSLTSEQTRWLADVIRGTYEVVDGKIDVYGDVYIPKDTKSFPVQFVEITGSFSCSLANITSLKGCPSKVGGGFDCSGTQITSLEGGPSEVGGYFSCLGTQITSLIDIADSITQIKGVIWADWDKIKSGGLGLVLIHGLKELASADIMPGQFKIINKYAGKPDLIFDCQAELIEAGFEEYAQL